MSQTKHKIVGTVNWTAGPLGSIILEPGWEAANIETFDVPELKGIQTYGGAFGGKVRFYKKAGPQLQAAWKAVKDHGLMSRVLFWDGSFVPRMIRGSTTKPSEHTFGCAFDINARWNGLNVTPPPAGQLGSVRELVPIFESFGFFWGGNWPRRDGMHFQIETLGVPELVEAFNRVEIWFNGVEQDVPALFIDGKTWVGAKMLAKKLYGTFDTYKPESGVAILTLDGQQHAFTAQGVGEVLYVPFSEVMPLYKVPYTFDREALKVEITTK